MPALTRRIGCVIINFCADWDFTGVALLPFIDEQRLLDALKDVYENLTDEQKQVTLLLGTWEV